MDRLSEFKQIADAQPKPEPPPPIPIAEEMKDVPKETNKKTKKQKKRKKGKEQDQTDHVAMPAKSPEDPLKMTQFFAQRDAITESLQQIERNRVEIEKANQRALCSVSEEEINECEAMVGALVNSTNKLSQQIRQLLKEMEQDTEQLAPQAPRGSGDLRMRRVNNAALVKKFSKDMELFQQVQQEARRKNAEQIKRQYKHVRPEAGEEELRGVEEAIGSMTLTSQQIFALGQTRNAQLTLERMKERRKDVMDIEKGLVTLHQLFVDMANLVEEQGALIDNLSKHMDETVEYTEQAQESMVEAVEMQKNIRRLKCGLF